MRHILLAFALLAGYQAFPTTAPSSLHPKKNQGKLEFPLLKRLKKAKAGDFLVLEANKTITLLAIRSLTDQSLVLEEISAPSAKVNLNSPTAPGAATFWSKWIQNKAPGHTSWSMIEIDLAQNRILECYSFNRNSWLSQSPQDSFLATLLHLGLTPVHQMERRRVGPAPQEGEMDRRLIWNPPLIVDGKKIDQAISDAYEAEWPQDGSELSGKMISLYFDQGEQLLLPCWIQIDTGQITASVRAIDSGHKLPISPHRSMPRRIPEFIGSPLKTKNGLRISVKSPKYYKQFELFAVDVTTKDKQIHLINHSLAVGPGDTLNLDIETSELQQVLLPDHKYTWLLVPSGYSGSYSEMPRPFTWQ